MLSTNIFPVRAAGRDANATQKKNENWKTRNPKNQMPNANKSRGTYNELNTKEIRWKAIKRRGVTTKISWLYWDYKLDIKLL